MLMAHWDHWHVPAAWLFDVSDGRDMVNGLRGFVAVLAAEVGSYHAQYWRPCCIEHLFAK